MKIKRLFCIVCAILALFALFCSGCGKNTTPAAEPGEHRDGVVVGNKGTNGVLDGAFKGSVEEFADADSAGIVADERAGDQYVPQAGTLTAGEWKDKANLSDWFEKTALPEWEKELQSRKIFSNNVFPIHVTSDGSNVFNEKIDFMDKNGKLLYTARTDVDGMAYLFCSNDDLDLVDKFTVGDHTEYLTKDSAGTVKEVSVSLERTDLKNLDLLFMIDTTGSMGDELSYIKSELSDVVKRVAKDTSLSIRISVNFYRDDGDEYVVKYFDFRDDVAECVKQIAEQIADGGGDFPEAVHTALDNAVNGHEWRDDAIKLCFLVLDAPPHTASEVQGVNESLINSIMTAAKKGIRIIPVASSGVDLPTEIDCRSFAIMTGGTYIFLTNDSGVGNDHLEASVGEYKVEPLNDCMVRVINEFCCVKTTEAEPKTEENTTANPNNQDQ